MSVSDTLADAVSVCRRTLKHRDYGDDNPRIEKVLQLMRAVDALHSVCGGFNPDDDAFIADLGAGFDALDISPVTAALERRAVFCQEFRRRREQDEAARNNPALAFTATT